MLFKRILIGTVFSCLLFLSVITNAQEATPKNNKANRTSKLIQETAGRPDIPGDLMIELGFNWVQEHPPGIGFNTMASRTFNAYYLYEMNLGKSALSFHPGIGIGTEKYAFAQDLTLGNGFDSLGNRQVQFVPLDSLYPEGVTFRRSQINPNYIDIPIEFRWRSRKYDPKRSLKVIVGGKVGFRFDSKTKIRYREESENKTTKQKESWQLNNIRYGVYGRIGFGGFSAFCYYSLSDLFRKDRGPMATTMYPLTFGLSLALF